MLGIVIDANALHCVFKEKTKFEQDFEPIKKRVENANAQIVYGGTKYIRELKKTPEYARILNRLKDAGKAARIDTRKVDDREKIIKKKTENTGCDDQHAIALLGVSRARIFCSLDRRSFPFIKDATLYPADMKKVKIYSGLKSINCLQKKNGSKILNIS